jgi:membrane protein required for colicin V production
MNALDIVLLVLVAVLTVIGVIKGLTRVLVGIGALACGFVLAAQFHESLAPRIGGSALAAFLLILLGTLLVGWLCAWLLGRLMKAAKLTWADRLAGGALGLAAAGLAAAVLVLPLVAYVPSGEKALENSTLAPYVTVVADLANHLVPAGMSERYRSKMESLRSHWRGRVG